MIGKTSKLRQEWSIRQPDGTIDGGSAQDWIRLCRWESQRSGLVLVTRDVLTVTGPWSEVADA